MYVEASLQVVKSSAVFDMTPHPEYYIFLYITSMYHMTGFSLGANFPEFHEWAYN